MARYKITCEINGEIRHFAGYQADSFADCGPIFNKGITERGRFIDGEVDQAVDQLYQMGYAVQKKLLLEKRRKGTHG